MVTYNTGDDLYGISSYIVDATAGQGNYQTIGAAITAAPSGTVIFIRPGTYTENITMKAGITLSSFPSGQGLAGEQTPTVIISGKAIDNGVGLTFAFFGIQLQTNSDYVVSITAASTINLTDCYVKCTNNTAFNCTNTSGNIVLFNCGGDLATTGIALASFTHGSLWLYSTIFTNSGSSTTGTTLSDGLIQCLNCDLQTPLACTSSGVIICKYTLFGTTLTPFFNQTWITTAGTGTSFVENCQLFSGTASAISIGTGTTVNCSFNEINSSNTNAITGAGTINYGALYFSGTSKLINTTTQTGGLLQGGVAQAPSAGFIGERIESVISSPGTSISNNTPTNVTSISLTAGVWDVSILAQFTGISTGTAIRASISTTSATEGTTGNNRAVAPVYGTTQDLFLVVPAYRLTLTTNTTVYWVGNALFTVGTCNCYGRISATRVG